MSTARRVSDIEPPVRATAGDAVGTRVLPGVSLGLGLDAEWFDRHLTAAPTVLFRIFRYPPIAEADGKMKWSVGEHTDYGLLTILAQDDNGGLEVHARNGWI